MAHRRTHNYPHLRRQATARLERQERAMESITSEGWTCPICGTVTARVVGRVESMETVDYAETIRQLRAERDAALAELNAAQIEINNQLTALKISHCAEVVEPLTAQLMIDLINAQAERDAARQSAAVWKRAAKENRAANRHNFHFAEQVGALVIQQRVRADAAERELARLRALLARVRDDLIEYECLTARTGEALDAALAQSGGAEKGETK